MQVQPSPQRHEYLPTGVAGLDNVLMGGFMKGGFYLVQGDPGSGKTTLALQFMQDRVRAKCRCLYVSLTESREDLERACRSHGWTLEGLELLDLTQPASSIKESPSSIYHPADTELSETVQHIAETCERIRPEHVVFDGRVLGPRLGHQRILTSVHTPCEQSRT